MANFESLKLENQYCHVIYSVSNALARYYKPMLKPLGLTYPQYLIMMALWDEDGVNIQSISKATFFDSGTLTPLLTKLKDKKFLSIQSDPKDLRHKIVKLTKSGHALKEKAASVPESLGCLFAGNPQEMIAMKKQLHVLHQVLRDFEEQKQKG